IVHIEELKVFHYIRSEFLQDPLIFFPMINAGLNWIAINTVTRVRLMRCDDGYLRVARAHREKIETFLIKKTDVRVDPDVALVSGKYLRQIGPTSECDRMIGCSGKTRKSGQLGEDVDILLFQ